MQIQTYRIKKWKMVIAAEAVLCLIAVTGIICDKIEVRKEQNAGVSEAAYVPVEEAAKEAISEGYIKWVDFGVSYDALCAAYEWDVNTWGEPVHIDWVEMLAYLGAKYGGDFAAYEKRVAKDMDLLAKQLTQEGKTMEELTEGMEYYAYYEEAYRAVLGGMVGEYEIAKPDGQGNLQWAKVYGLKAYSPIAKGFEYSHYADFGSSRSYGYQRQHLGHDMMGQVGTPI